jgi:hypothetical protein
MQQEADQQRAEVMDAHLGDNVTAPRGGEPCIVAAIYPDGGRLVSHGGSYPADFIGWCRCESEPDARYFEFVGGREDGSHGWYDARCSRVFQWG